MRHIALVALFALTSSGCATVLGGPQEKINIASSPSGATILLNGDSIGTTPKVINISRFRAPDIALRLEGCQPYAVQIQRNFRTVPFLLNIITPPLSFLGMGVDAATGAMFDLEPNFVNPALSCPRRAAFGIGVEPAWIAAILSESAPQEGEVAPLSK